MGVTSPVFPELWVNRAWWYYYCFAELHTTVHYKVNMVIMVWVKIEFQNKIRNGKIPKLCKQKLSFCLKSIFKDDSAED